MAAVNEYDSFSYLKPADYTPRMKEVYGEINEGFERAEQMAKVNDKQRMANAKIMGKAIDNTMAFSKTMAGYLKKEQEKRENIFKNRAARYRMEAGATLEGMRIWEIENEKIKGDYTYHQYLADQVKDKNPELANQMANMTGWQVRVFKEGLLKQAVVNYESNLTEGVNAKNADGSWKYTVKRDDGSLANWSIASDTERQAIISDWEDDAGFNDISFASAEFLEKHYTSQKQQKLNTLLAGYRQQDVVEQNAARIKNYDDQFIISAKHGSLGEKVHELIEIEVGWYKGDHGAARTAVKERLFSLVREGKIELGELTQLSNFKFEHRGYKDPVDLTVFKEFQNWGGEIATLAEGIRQQESAERKAQAAAIVQELKKGEAEHGAYEESDKPALLAMVRQRIPGITDAEIPDYIKNLMTVEKREDMDYEQVLEWKWKTGTPINNEDWMYINDQELKKTWQERSQQAGGTGIPKSISSLRKRDVHSAVGQQLTELKGRSDEKTLEFNTLKDRAVVKYNQYYQFYQEGWTGSDGELHRKIMSLVKEDLPAMAAIPLYSEDRDTRKFRRDLETARNQLKAGWTADTKTSPRDTLATVLLKDSEPYYADLEKYAANPAQGRIPSYYYKIAKNYSYLTAWDVANLQYKSQTGKELPKPYQIQTIEKYHPTIRRLFTHNPTPKGTLIRSNQETDFSKEHVTEGIQ